MTATNNLWEEYVTYFPSNASVYEVKPARTIKQFIIQGKSKGKGKM